MLKFFCFPMDLSVHIHNYPFCQRLFFTRSLNPIELRDYVALNSRELYGAGIRVYSPFWGKILAIFGIAQKWATHFGTFYLNTNSLKKYFYRLFVIYPCELDLHQRVNHIGHLMSLPISPLSIFSDSRSRFAVRAKGLMTSLNVHYHILKTSGYAKSVLSQLQLPQIMQALGHD